jgi:hypothetical protein
MNMDKMKEAAGKLLAKIHAYEDVSERARWKKLVGRCYKYRNSYGGNNDTWWMYFKITGFREAFSFQTDCQDKITIEQHGGAYDVVLRTSHRIAKREFDGEWRALQGRIKEVKP